MLARAIRRRLDAATGLVLCMAVGWWAGFGILVLGLGLRMTPPRGDNWAGCLGMTLAALGWLGRSGLGQAARAGLVCGFIGGIGFAAASMLKLVEVTSGYATNWHSILEQTTGLFNGLALAAALAPLVRFGPAVDVEAGSQTLGRRTAPFALAFVVLGITYLNLRKNAASGSGSGAVPETMAGLSAEAWFDLASLLIALSFLTLLVRHSRRPLAIVPSSPMGRGQLLYVVLLWWLVAGNFERALVHFTAPRLVTEGVIGAVALLCTLIVLAWPPPDRAATGRVGGPRPAVAGADDRGRPDRGGRRDRLRLGGGPRHVRRPVRRARQPPHPVRPERDDPSRREAMSAATLGGTAGAGLRRRPRRRSARATARVTVAASDRATCGRACRPGRRASAGRRTARVRSRTSTGAPCAGGPRRAGRAARSGRAGSRSIALMMIASRSSGNPRWISPGRRPCAGEVRRQRRERHVIGDLEGPGRASAPRRG